MSARPSTFGHLARRDPFGLLGVQAELTATDAWRQQIDPQRIEDAMIHAKTMTVEGRWSTLGTANVDRLSLTGSGLTLADRELRSDLVELTERIPAPLRPLL